MRNKKIKKALYHIFNTNVCKYGKPFALCDKCMIRVQQEYHYAEKGLMLIRIANDTNWKCNICERQKR